MRHVVTLLFALFLLSHPVFAQPDAKESDDSAEAAKLQELLQSLKYQDGEVTLRGGLAKIKIPSNFRYLSPEDADTVLVKLWGNPPSRQESLGLIVPANTTPADPNAWAVVITYEEEGYVKDDDANKINYDDLLKEMKENTRAASEQRVKKGYAPIELVGWAAPPHYDATAKKLYWAKELKFGDSDEHTLNYNIRVLGRRGVLVLNAVAATSQLKEIEAATPTILAAVDFQEGHRYADFNAATDKTATYGLAALVAGGVLAKTGMFAKFGLIFAKFAKLIIIGAVALFAGIAKLFGKKSNG